MGPLAQVVRAIANQRPSAHIVVITGRNAALHEDLTRMPLPIPVQVEGFVDNMDVWMRAADVLVTKAGPNTLAEAFIAGLPLVLYTALPGQEQGNVELVVRHDAGVWAPLPRQAARAVVQLLENPELRTHMAARARALARPMATEQIARALWSLSTPPGLREHHDARSGADPETLQSTTSPP
jgi:1,2-diacylglycerol 3-beta-galactosyltransferase